MKKTNIVLIGAGGHALSVIDVIERHGKYTIIGLIGAPDQVGMFKLGYPVIGIDSNLEKIFLQCTQAIIAIGQISNSVSRADMYKLASDIGFQFPLIASPLSYISPHAKIGSGTIIMHGATINAGASVGNNCIINSKALVEHGCIVEDNCHIATGAILNGDVYVSSWSFIGSGSVIQQGARIGSNVVIGMGLFVRQDIPDGLHFYG